MSFNLGKKLAVFLTAAAVCLLCAVPVSAESGKWNSDYPEYKLFADCPECNYIRTGGTNKLDSIKAENREETEELEGCVRTSDYVLVNTSEKEISDDDLNILKQQHFTNPDFLDAANWKYKSGDYRVYVYRPTLQTVLEQTERDGYPDLHSVTELNTSTVVIDYFTWYCKERIGSIMTVNEINSNLPERYEADAGFVLFKSPIDCELLLHLIDNDYYYLLPVPKGETLMKLRSEHYEIKTINAVEMQKDDDALLANTNYFVIYGQPETEPYEVDITKVVDKNGIQSIDLTGKPDTRWGAVYEPADIEEHPEVIVNELKHETQEEKEPEKTGLSVRLIVSVLIIGFAAIGLIYLKITRKDD